MNPFPSIDQRNEIQRRANLLVLTPNREISSNLQVLRDEFKVRVIPSIQEIPTQEVNVGNNFNVVLVDVSQDSRNMGLSMAKKVRAQNSKIPILILVKESSEEFARTVLRERINDYLCSQFSRKDMVDCLQRCGALNSREAACADYGKHYLSTLSKTIVGNSLAIQELRTYLMKVSVTDSTVLITGETGTGKELVAKAIHEGGMRQKKPFVSVNCGAIPETLLESELFGFDQGAFTGALVAKKGKMEQAQEGTLFFDEVGEMSPHGQAKMLRVIEEREVDRLGGKKSIPIDVRIMAATNQDLDQLMTEGKFRKDLYYRLNVARIHLPPLRDRKEDIPLLIQHYVQDFNKKFNRQVEGINEEAMEYLFQYSWPGNIRELKNLVEGAFINIPEKRNSLLGLPPQFRAEAKKYEHLPQAERDRILSALAATNWNRSKAAQELQWSRMTLYRKMEKYQIAKHIS
jgi:DNA-binding NtrC family response regulator